MRTSGDTTLCQVAVVVMIASQASGTAVTQAYRALPCFTRMPVAIHKRNTREQLIRDAEQRPENVDAAVRIDDADVEEIAPSCDDETARHQHRRIPRGLAERLPDVPSMSCSMKRPTRVPASSVVRMNTASNMMAK